MPPQQGEVSLLTLFADVHYYFGPPSQIPPHHRFDKGSYVYLYHDPMRHSGRIEVANSAGTPKQDAFAGHLDTVKVEHTYKHPCLFTVTLDACGCPGGSPSVSPHQHLSQWHLPAHDPTNQTRYLYKLYIVDLYFWTPDDAVLFLDSLRRVLQPHQLDVTLNPHVPPAHVEHRNDTMSPVIARLESAAMTHSSRSPSINTPSSFPGPPTAPPPASSSPSAQTANYAPMAYNPAAPAPPEPIAHREKTPPPLDAAEGTGLGAAAMHDQHPGQYSNPLQASFAPQPTSAPYMPGPPAPGHGFTERPGHERTKTTGALPSSAHSPPSFAPPPSAPPPGQYGMHEPPKPGIQRTATMPVQQYANYPGSPGFPPAPQSPPAHGALPSPSHPPKHQYELMASPPQGSYSQFSYNSTGAHPSSAIPHPQSIHQQFYRPSENDAGVVECSNPIPTPKEPQRNSNMGKRVEKVEKGVGRFLKKLDQKF